MNTPFKHPIGAAQTSQTSAFRFSSQTFAFFHSLLRSSTLFFVGGGPPPLAAPLAAGPKLSTLHSVYELGHAWTKIEYDRLALREKSQPFLLYLQPKKILPVTQDR